VRFGVAVPTWGLFSDLDVVADFLRLTEDLGFHSAWFADHVAIPAYATDLLDPPMLEPLTLATWALATHETLHVGTDVLVAPYRHPILIAAMAGSAQRLSAGRLTLGVGIGYLVGEFAALGVEPDHRGSRTDETLEALGILWSGRGPHSYSGRFFQFEDVLPVAVPTAPVPVLVGGNKASACVRAARFGDGWHPLYPTPGEYHAGRQRIQALRVEYGNDSEFVFSLSTAHTEVTDAPLRVGRRGSGRAGIRPEYTYAPERPRDGDGRPLLCGSAEQVTGDIDAYRQAGVDQIVLRVWNSSSRLGVDGALGQLRRWAEILNLKS
jgi:probable F420-dependent oxidoreductase